MLVVVCMLALLCVCLSVLSAEHYILHYSFAKVQDVLVTGLNGLTIKVQSLEDKYVKFLYRKVAALEKCSPCNPQSGKHYYHKCIM